jgi:hypothetical protein
LPEGVGETVGAAAVIGALLRVCVDAAAEVVVAVLLSAGSAPPGAVVGDGSVVAARLVGAIGAVVGTVGSVGGATGATVVVLLVVSTLLLVVATELVVVLTLLVVVSTELVVVLTVLDVLDGGVVVGTVVTASPCVRKVTRIWPVRPAASAA